MKNITTYIMAGGRGERLAPFSTPEKPKPFLNIINQHRTMLQMTVDRVQRFGVPYVITHERHRQKTAEQCQSDIAGIVQETKELNTAYTVLQAAQHCNPNNICLVVPSDHYIESTGVFISAIRDVQEQLSRVPDVIHMFGVPALYPSTEYGYINPKTGDFREKPDSELAKTYIKSGYLWNTGIYMFSPSTIIKRFHETRPKFMIEPERMSFDKAIVEMYPHKHVTPLETDWSDLGTWKSIYDHLKTHGTRSGNGVYGIGSWSATNCNNSLILNYSHGNPSLRDLENKVVIFTNDTPSKYFTCDLDTL